MYNSRPHDEKKRNRGRTYLHRGRDGRHPFRVMRWRETGSFLEYWSRRALSYSVEINSQVSKVCSLAGSRASCDLVGSIAFGTPPFHTIEDHLFHSCLFVLCACMMWWCMMIDFAHPSLLFISIDSNIVLIYRTSISSQIRNQKSNQIII